MQKSILLLILSVLTLSLNAQLKNILSEKEKEAILQSIESNADTYFESAMKIWEYAEMGYQEKKSSAHLKKVLEQEGFKIESGVADIPTAFIASYGNGQPIIGILGEYDALPGVSQTAAPFREKREEVNAGHACGHHLFGAGSMAAAIQVKDWMIANNKKGTIRFYGTPAEEGGGGKVYLVRAGLFNDVDAILHWHPSNQNSAHAASSLANKSAKFRFYGTAAHAARYPFLGRSALDAVESMNYMVNLMREHVPQESRTHYVITSGGEAPNVVPEFAEVFYYARHPDMAQVVKNFDWIVKIAEAAAKATETKMEYEVIHGLYNVLPNETLSRIMHDNLSYVGGYSYNAEEQAFAEKIVSTFAYADNVSLNLTENIAPFKIVEKGVGGSTDVGDVSWAVPTAGMRAATWVPGTSSHTWQAVAAGGTSIGKRGMLMAIKSITLTAIDLFNNQDVLEQAKLELKRRQGSNFNYQPLLGDRKPPLDYRM